MYAKFANMQNIRLSNFNRIHQKTQLFAQIFTRKQSKNVLERNKSSITKKGRRRWIFMLSNFIAHTVPEFIIFRSIRYSSKKSMVLYRNMFEYE